MDEIVDECRATVQETLEEQRIGPELRVQDFDDYIHLINGEVNSIFESNYACIPCPIHVYIIILVYRNKLLGY